MDHYQTEATLAVTKFGINDVNTYRFQMERSVCEAASIMGVPTSHIHFAPKQAQSFHKIYVACCSKTHCGVKCYSQHTVLGVRVLPRVPSGQGMSLVSPDVTCRAPRVPDVPGVSGLLMTLASALD